MQHVMPQCIQQAYPCWSQGGAWLPGIGGRPWHHCPATKMCGQGAQRAPAAAQLLFKCTHTSLRGAFHLLWKGAAWLPRQLILWWDVRPVVLHHAEKDLQQAQHNAVSGLSLALAAVIRQSVAVPAAFSVHGRCGTARACTACRQTGPWVVYGMCMSVPAHLHIHAALPPHLFGLC